QSHTAAYALHRDLLALRRDTAAFAHAASDVWPRAVDGCVLGASTFALRFFTPDHADDRLLIVNLGTDLVRRSIAEPLLAPPDGRDWIVAWSSEDAAYGGTGTALAWPDHGWHVAGESALLMAPGPRRERRPGPKRRTA